LIDAISPDTTMTQTANQTTNPLAHRTRTRWVIGLCIAAWLLGLAAVRPLALPDEGRYAEISRWMLVSGDWLAPRLDGMPFFHKPPLLHWLHALVFQALGAHPWTARLVTVGHALLMLWALHWGTVRLGAAHLAGRATLMLGTTLAVLVGGQYINHDMLVACWISVSIWCFAAALHGSGQPNAGLARLGFAACALGVLSKGLIGLALPGLVMVLWVLWTRQFQRVWRLPWLSGALVFCALALPWFILADHHYPGLIDYLFGTQQFTRYTATGFNNVHPWWFYGVALALLAAPWSWVLPWAVMSKARSTATATATDTAQRIPRTLWLLCWIWLVLILVFFSIPASKIVGYMLPVMPPLAVLTAWAWDVVMGRGRDRVFCAIAVGGALLGLAVTLIAGRLIDHKSSRDTAAELACRASAGDAVYAIDGYPYDLPFYAGLVHPIRVVQDWDKARISAGDDWRRELFESARFDQQAAEVLQSTETLTQAALTPHNWLVVPANTAPSDPRLEGWSLVFTGTGWALWQSALSARESPVTAEAKGQNSCQDHATQKRP